jgi:hypothetical protein
MARDPGAFGSSGQALPSALSSAPERACVALTTAEVAEFLDRLPTLDSAVSDAERVEQLALLEAVKAAAAGAQAKVSVDFAASQREVQAASGVPARKRGLGVAAQVALARRESPHAGSRHLGLATALHTELPHTRAHLAGGRVSEWTATVVARESAHLAPAERRTVDAAIAADLPGWSPRRAEREVRALAQRLDPAAAVARASKAEQDRRVTIRPAPDTMAILTATLPVAQGIACFAALNRVADQQVATGEAGGRSRGQVMADTLVQRLTGQVDAAKVPVEVQLVMTDTTLLTGGTEPAHLAGHGPIPAALARRLLRGDTDADTDPGSGSDSGSGPGARCAPGGGCPRCAETNQEAAVWVRRLYTSPDGSALVAMDSRRRTFAGGLRRFLIARDQTCRTPWCDAPIRDGDHAQPHRATGGDTTVANGQGLCQACNHAKEAPGWRHEVTDPGPPLHSSPPPRGLPPPGAETTAGAETTPGDRAAAGRHTVRITTPTGHDYASTAPRPPGWNPWPDVEPASMGGRVPEPVSALESHLETLIAA